MTSTDYAGLLAVCEKLTRAFVGKFASDEKGDYFLIPEKAPVLAAAVDSLKPGPGGDDKYTAEEMKRILH